MRQEQRELEQRMADLERKLRVLMRDAKHVEMTSEHDKTSEAAQRIRERIETGLSWMEE